MSIFVDDLDLVRLVEVGHLPPVDFHTAQTSATVPVLFLAVLAGLLCEGVGVKFNGDRAACDDHWFFGHGFASFVAGNEVKGLQLKSAQLLLIGQHVWSREITAISLRAPSLLQVR